MLLESGLMVALCIAAAAAVLPLVFFLRAGTTRRRGWRIRRVAVGRWLYEEKRDGVWVGVPFEEHPDSEKPPYVVMAPSEDTWRTFPEWTRQRRAEIIERVRFALAGKNCIVSAHGPSASR
jgi:hypothetical protein